MTRRSRRNKPGRPRLIDVPSTLAPREQILQAAGALFVAQGFTATSTRDIAEAVGIRQASLYYHLAGKEEMVEELLALTVRPTSDQVDRIEDLTTEHGWAAALYVLVMIDTKTLADAPHNVGRLASLPDVRNLEAFKPYKATRDALVEAYERFGRRVAGLDVSGLQLTHLAEVVITFRTEGTVVDDQIRHAVAAAALRVCGADQDAITLAAAVSWADFLE